MASLGLSLPLSPPPASFLQRGWAGSSLEFLRAIVLRTAGGVFRPVNFFLSVPQFKRAPSDCSQGLLPVLTLSNGVRSSPFYPHLLVAGAVVWSTFLLGVAFRHNLWALFNFSSQLDCPPRFENFPQTRQCEGFLVLGNFLY